MAPHSSTVAWKIPWTEESSRLQSMGSLRVGHDWATSLFLFSLSCIGEGNGNPLQSSCLENPRDGEAWWAAIYGVTQSRTRLKWLSIQLLLLASYFCSSYSSLEFLHYWLILTTWFKLEWRKRCQYFLWEVEAQDFIDKRKTEVKQGRGECNMRLRVITHASPSQQPAKGHSRSFSTQHPAFL